jgi:anti-sigma factor RsiW
MPNAERIRHLTEDTLNLHALGDLPHGRHRKASEHLSNCQHCNHRLREISEFIVHFKTAARKSRLAADQQR